jgi:hypothetical protein
MAGMRAASMAVLMVALWVAERAVEKAAYSVD